MDATICYTQLQSPVGSLLIYGDGETVAGLLFPNHRLFSSQSGHPRPDPLWQKADDAFRVAREQLCEYFEGQRQQFDIPLKLQGTNFQQQVWQELVKIPYGTTISYAELARRVGQPTASRAVGSANARNPVSLIVPCHRVIGADGRLTGYAGGTETKQWLLDWERQTSGALSGRRFERVGT